MISKPHDPNKGTQPKIEALEQKTNLLAVQDIKPNTPIFTKPPFKIDSIYAYYPKLQHLKSALQN
jgi:hypothetical protein